MPAPELVICPVGDGAKKYPGGVIALAAADWLGPARGTLTTEADARSISGTVVRDTQLVTVPSGNIFSDTTAMGDAEDTLVIDTSLLPIEDGMAYTLLFSMLIEGDWDPTNVQSSRNTVSSSLIRAAALHWFGDGTFFLSESDFAAHICYPRLMPHYCLVQSNGRTGSLDGDEELHIRAYGMAGTTVEWLLDQIILMPHSGDFRATGGDLAEFTFAVFDGDHIDGADGGDAFGKFTVHPQNFSKDNQFPWYGDPGGGDYQRKADADDAEYYVEVREDDFLGPLDGPDGEANAHCYGAHGSYITSPIEWVNDPFARTVNDGDFAGADNHFAGFTWGHTPEGLSWRESPQVIRRARGPATDAGLRYGASMWTDGAGKAYMHVRRKPESDSTPATGFIETGLQPGGDTTIMRGYLELDDLRASGKFTLEEQNGLPTTGSALPYIELATAQDLIAQHTGYRLRFDITTRSWSLLVIGAIGSTAGTSLIHGPVDISSFWADGVAVAWRIEVMRYVLRVKVWEASGSEPSSWDYEDFRPIRVTSGGLYENYDYSGDLDDAWGEVDVFSFACRIHTGVQPGAGIENLKVSWEDIVVQTNLHDDDLGSVDDATESHYQMERPMGTPVGEIEVPFGAQYLVYWGSRDWTEADEFGDPYITFAMKAWNPTDAPLMQRAETLFWYWVIKPGGIVSMNWRSADRRNSADRVLIGDR